MEKSITGKLPFIGSRKSVSADNPMTVHRRAQTSGWRLSALTNQIWFPADDWQPPKIACEKKTFRNSSNVIFKIWFCGYHGLLLHNHFLISKTFVGEIIENFHWIGSGYNGIATHFNRRIFCGILSNHCCSGHSCKKVFLCRLEYLNTLHTHTLWMFLFHYKWLSKFYVLYNHINLKMELWKIPPVKTMVAHRTAQSLDSHVPSLSVWSTPGLVRSPIGRFLPQPLISELV